MSGREMECYEGLVEKTRVPQACLQRLAVDSIFEKLRSAPRHLNPDSEPGSQAITHCLNSPSPYVVDRSVRQLCRLAADSLLTVSRASLHLLSALHASHPKLVPLFVKGLGFLARHHFLHHHHVSSPTHSHPFIRVLLCRPEVQSELLHQVLLFVLQNKHVGMIPVSDFLRPLLNVSIIKFLVLDSSSSSFALQLVSSMLAFCCSFPHDSLPLFKLLIQCFMYLPHETSEDYSKLVFVVEHMVDAYIVVLKSLAASISQLITEAQLCAVEFLETILCLSTYTQCHPGGHELICEHLKRLLSVQKDLGLPWVPGLSSTILSLFTIILQSELEHEQISIMKLLLLILKWKYANDAAISGNKFSLFEETLFLLPVVSLMSSPSKSVKGLATELLLLLEKLLVKMSVAPKDKPIVEGGVHCLSTPGTIVLRLLQHL